MNLGIAAAVAALLALLITPSFGNFPDPGSLVSYLQSISGSHTISGQFIELGPIDPIVAIYNSTGQWLGLIGGDYWWYGETDFQGYYSFNPIAIDYWNNGGLVTLSLCMPNPTTGGGVNDVSNMNVNDLFTPGTDTYNNFITLLNTVGGGIQQLQKAGVIVIFRPFHEMQGNWFWWGTTYFSSQQFIQLWQFTHDFMTNNMSLNNIVWLWAGNSDLSLFPGTQYADMVGQDLYSSQPSTDGQDIYNTQTSVGVPIVLSEFGPGNAGSGDPSFNETDLITAIQQSMPNTVYWLQWWDGNAGNPGWGMAECQDVSQALNDPWVINRDQLQQYHESQRRK